MDGVTDRDSSAKTNLIAAAFQMSAVQKHGLQVGTEYGTGGQRKVFTHNDQKRLQEEGAEYVKKAMGCFMTCGYDFFGTVYTFDQEVKKAGLLQTFTTGPEGRLALNALSEECTLTAKPSLEKSSSSIGDAAISIQTSTTANTVTNNSILNRMYNMYKCNNMPQLKNEEDPHKTYDAFMRKSLQDQIDLVGKYNPSQKLYVARMALATVEEHMVNYCLYNYRSSAYVPDIP